MTEPSLPWGPRGLPLVGNAFQVDPTGLHKTLAKLAETYGGVFSINLLGQNIVVLNSNEAIYEALVLKDDDFSGRPPSSCGEKVMLLFCFNYFINHSGGTYLISPKWQYPYNGTIFGEISD